MISRGGHNGEVESKIDALLNELQLIWDEIGEYEENRNRMLHELKLECLEVYRRKVTAINLSRANMHQLLADIHREIVSVASELGDHPAMAQLEKRGLPLKQQLSELEPILTDIRRKKIERIRLFQDVRVQIQNLRNEIYSSPFSELPTQEQDLSIEKLDELQGELRALQKEKTERLPKVMDLINKIHGLCQVFDCDPLPTIREVHPSLDDSSANHPRNLSDETIQRLNFTVQTMLAEKRSRMQQIQDLGTSLLELWNLLDTPAAEQQPFQHVTCNIAAAEEDFVAAGSLSQHIIEQAEAEVKRLEELKASKMKELVLKRRNDLDELCGKGHLVVDGLLAADDMLACVESGDIDLQELLANIEQHIGNVKEEMFSRKDIMEITEKWFAALEAERWLEEYNKDENRYNTTRGAHLNLMRAERARAKTNKIPAILEILVEKTVKWEGEKGKPFLYDGIKLLSTIEDYKVKQMEKDEVRRRHREQRRLQEQSNEQETSFAPKTSPAKTPKTPPKKGIPSSRSHFSGTAPAGTRRLSMGTAVLQQEQSMVARKKNVTSTTRDETVNKQLEVEKKERDPHGAAEDMPGTPTLGWPATFERVPLTPVGASGIGPNSNTQSSNCNHDKATIASFRSIPCSTETLDTENATPFQHVSLYDVHVGQTYELQEVQDIGLDEHQELSFEEKRLAFLRSH